MFTRTPVSLMLTLLSALAAAVVAFPAGTFSSIVPEVVPHPSLPSLASLNLTSAKLYAMGTPPVPVLPPRQDFGYDPTCEYWSTGAANDASACFFYLSGLGNTMCTIAGPDLVSGFCTAGSAAITGNVMYGQPPISVTCYNVASALQWVINVCNQGGQVGGYQVTTEDRNLIVAAKHAG